METITWLHLSDLHFHTAAGPAWDADVVLRALLKDVRERIARDGLRPDLVLVSGDIAYSGDLAEYALADRFFDQVLETAGLPKERLFVVPGNHDVDRSRVGFMARQISPTLTSRDAVNGLLGDPEARRIFLARQAGYGAFLADHLGHLPFDDERYFYARRLELAGRQVAILGLNSAWLAHGGGEDRNCLALGERQVRAALDAAAGSDLRIAVMHHPFDWLRDFDRTDCEALLTQGCQFILHGHLHRAGLLGLQTPDAKTTVVAAGACFDTRRAHNSYNLVRLNLREGQGAVHLRMYSDQGGGFWAKDTLTYKNVDGCYTFALSLPEKTAQPPIRRRADLSQARERYLRHLAERYRYLDFKGMGVSDRVPLRLPLVEMYVPLKARVEMPEGETWSRELHLAGRKVSDEEAEAIGRRLSEPLPALELLGERDGLIVLGDPGAGKTTFLKYLALRLAMGEGPALGLGERLPVLLPLSAYANALAKGDTSLGDFMAGYYHSRGGDLPLGPLLDEALAEGEALFLLDGLDEVRDPAQRALVVNRVVDFYTFHRPQGNKFVLTSRIVGYREVRPAAEGLAECTLVDFDEKEIAEFVDKWTAALERAAQGETAAAVQDAAREREELLASVRRNPGVRRLAANPLLLTILALMKRQGVALPERRVELYQKYVETLLKNWNLARGLDRPPSRDLDVVETVRVLAPLALWMHETSPGVGLVKREAMRRELAEIYEGRQTPDPEKAARQLLDDAHDYAGLLLERGPGEYGFIHLTFQEYLAAVAIAQRGQREVGPAVGALAAHIGDDNWREVSLLTVGYLGIVQQRDEAAGAVLKELIQLAPGEPGQAAILAGEAVADAWPGGVTPACKATVTEAVLGAMTDGARVKPALRAAAGDALARLGDPRFRASAWFLPDEPLLGFVEVPAGPFLMGSDKKRDRSADDDELPQHTVSLPAYYIARYPVTVAQFRAFARDSGYRAQGNWEQYGETDNRPVVAVTWHDARAYCAWLTERLAGSDLSPGGLFPSPGQAAAGSDPQPVARLPTEAEWEKAARGVDGRIFPWGDEADPNRANYWDTGIRTTSAVGCFPGGASPYRALDLAGNVWEWCQSLYKPYPYEAGDGREDLQAEGRRVLRGGSWYYSRDYARCACRRRLDPDLRSDVGFRVVVAPGSLGSGF